MYRALIIVFDTGHYKKLLLHMIGYGIPILVSVITLIVGLLISINNEFTYHSHNICWLGEQYLFAAFYPPLILMLCFNIVILIIGMRINLKVIKIYGFKNVSYKTSKYKVSRLNKNASQILVNMHCYYR